MSRFGALLEELDVNVRMQFHDTTVEYTEEVALYLDLVDVLTSATLTQIMAICIGLMRTLAQTQQSAALRACVVRLVTAAAAASDMYTTMEPRLAIKLLELMDRDELVDTHVSLTMACKLTQLVDPHTHKDFVRRINLYRRCVDFVALDGTGTACVVKELLNTFMVAECTTVSSPFWRIVTQPVFEIMYRQVEHSEPHLRSLVTLTARYVNSPFFASTVGARGDSSTLNLDPAQLLRFCCENFKTSQQPVSLVELVVVCVQHQYYVPSTYCAPALRVFLQLDREAGTRTLAWKVAAIYAQCMLFVGCPDSAPADVVDLACVASSIRYYCQNDLYIMAYHQVEVILVLFRLHALPYAHVAQLINVETFQYIAAAAVGMLASKLTPASVRATLVNTLDLYLYFAGRFELPMIGAIYAETIVGADADTIRRLLAQNILLSEVC
ncbi:hypothetical protein SARC_06413 [Sphaeroforma arctica JP610]|uniref:Uncharacterized protein n=1 Tax=Sphaeroforma arctica JP610 TaxID=667725 RepID=A0A0L0FZ42_9EUKA|nr:hypothetical protein SARC_06413 [Sphaeroforma arctica JP610]KNC81238.1 hypothetical protein SARC_06413 [Sphaeroforma arctica JP610]|eukprot:XP_014155140.1 hypothetical protein SARC_06413 [Sphaeroforma arctica JP610]